MTTVITGCVSHHKTCDLRHTYCFISLKLLIPKENNNNDDDDNNNNTT